MSYAISESDIKIMLAYAGVGDEFYPPNEIIDAANTVRDWLREHDATKLCGLKLADD